MYFIADFDDFSDNNNGFKYLFELKKLIPEYKVTLFTIPSRSSDIFLSPLAKTGWIELAIHGDFHSYLECKEWSKEKTIEVLNKYEKWGCFVKGFKAPYWEVSPGLYDGLKEKGYWIADHDRNDNIRPEGMNVYKVKNVSGYKSIHGHIQNVCGNGLQENFEYYKKQKGEYKFISEILNIN